MAQEILRKGKVKVVPPKEVVEGTGVVLVGTYKEKQLAWIRKHGVYNYPVVGDDELTETICAKITELWLYADVKATRHAFAATFVRRMSRTEFLAAYPTYPKSSKSTNKVYCVFKTTPLDYGTLNDGQFVIARTVDFGGRSVKVKKAVQQFKADGEFAPLATYLPSDLVGVPRQKLHVCEEAVQMDFLGLLDTLQTTAVHSKTVHHVLDDNLNKRMTCLDFFAGSGLVSEGLALDFRTVWANDISQKKALVFNANNVTGVLQVCPIENVDGQTLPSVDMSWGSFPCQDLSLAGVIKGLNASRSGLFWQWLRVMDEMAVRPPVVVAENVVGLVSASEGRYYVAVHDELSRRGYRVGAVMLDAAYWLPQSRKRIFVVGVRKGIDISALSVKAPTWCHSEPVVRVSKLVKDWVWWKIPVPQSKQHRLEDIIDFESPCDSEEEHLRRLALISPDKLRMMRELSLCGRRAFSGYRRTRDHRQVLEVRTDGMAGCLRTPGGGSSRQILVIAENGVLRTRLLTVREAARLMGAPDSYMIPGSYNDGYMAMGDAVAVPVVQYLSRHLLAPLVLQSRQGEAM